MFPYNRLKFDYKALLQYWLIGQHLWVVQFSHNAVEHGTPDISFCTSRLFSTSYKIHAYLISYICHSAGRSLPQTIVLRIQLGSG